MVNYSFEEKNPIIALTSNEIDILMHSVTCQGVLAIGVAKQIGITFPFVAVKNFKTCKHQGKNARGLMGYFSASFDKIGSRKYGIYNLYCQDEPGPGFHVRSAKDAIKRALLNLGPTKKSGQPLRYGITLVGTEFRALTEEQSIDIIEDVLSDLYLNRGLAFHLTIYKYET